MSDQLTEYPEKENRMEEIYSDDRLKSFKDLFLNTFWGRMVVLGGAVAGIALTYNCITQATDDDSEARRANYIFQRQQIGDLRPDIYIERDGVKYFSHIDGKEISDLVK